MRSEIHLVREHSLADGEGRSQVLAEKLLLRVLLQGAEELTVNLDLVLLALFRDDIRSLLLLEDFAFAVTNFLRFGPAEVIVVQSLRQRHAGNVDLSLGGDDVDLVDPPERASVDAERSGDQQQTGSQLLQKDDAFALVSAGQQDQHGPWRDGRTQFAIVLAERLLVGGLPLLAALRGQRSRHLLQLDDSLFPVLLTAKFFRHRRRLLDDCGLLRRLVLNEGGLLVVHFGAREPHDASVDLYVSSSVSHLYFLFIQKFSTIIILNKLKLLNYELPH